VTQHGSRVRTHINKQRTHTANKARRRKDASKRQFMQVRHFSQQCRAESGRSRRRCKSCVWPRHARCCSPERILELLQVDRLVVGGESGKWMLGLFWKGAAQHGERTLCCCVVLAKGLVFCSLSRSLRRCSPLLRSISLISVSKLIV
jgi:hypothetical protein